MTVSLPQSPRTPRRGGKACQSTKAGKVWKARVTVDGREESLRTALEREVTLDRGKVHAPMSSLRCIQPLNLSCAHTTRRCAVERVGPDVGQLDVPSSARVVQCGRPSGRADGAGQKCRRQATRIRAIRYLAIPGNLATSLPCPVRSTHLPWWCACSEGDRTGPCRKEMDARSAQPQHV